MLRLSQTQLNDPHSVRNIHCPDIRMELASQESRGEAVDGRSFEVPENTSNSQMDLSSLSLGRILLESNNQQMSSLVDGFDFGEISMIQVSENNDAMSCFADCIPFTLKALGIAAEPKDADSLCDLNQKSLSDYKIPKRRFKEPHGNSERQGSFARWNGLYEDLTEANWSHEPFHLNWGPSSSRASSSKRQRPTEFDLLEYASPVARGGMLDAQNDKQRFKKIKEKTLGCPLNKEFSCRDVVTVLHRRF